MDEPQTFYAQWSAGPPAQADFFPIAVWLQTPSNAGAYEAAGVNLFVGLWEGPTKSQLATLQSAGMPVFCHQNATGLSSPNASVIQAWTQDDEPDNSQPDGSGGWDPPIEPSVIIDIYDAIRAADATRPVYLNLGQGVAWDGWYGRGVRTDHPEDYFEYVKGCDIASFDIYPVNSSDAEVSGNLWYVAQGVDRLRTCVGDLKPVWCWIECTQIDADSAAKPAPAQVRSEVWMALVHGANGIGYFCHSWYPTFVEPALLQDAEMLAAVTTINGRITSLAAVLNSPTVVGGATVGSSTTGVPIDLMVKQHGGVTYVFAVCMRDGATTGSFDVAGLGVSAQAEVLDEGRQIQVTGGQFTDQFQPYEAHLYRITDQPAPDQSPVVSFTSPAGGATVSGTVQVNALSCDADVGTSDGDGIQNVVFELRQAGTLLAMRTENLVTYDWSLDTTVFADGDYTLRATATSTAVAGGTSASTEIAVSVVNGSSADADTDSDGIPDWWEELYFPAGGAAPDDDPDADGFTNLEEYERGSDPTVPETTDGGTGLSCEAGNRAPTASTPVLLLFASLLPASRLRRRRASPMH
jgi:hypothetical protein